MSIRLKRHVGVLVTGLALLAAALSVLPGVAKAQDTASVQDDARDVNRSIDATFPVGSPDGAPEVTADDLLSVGVHERAARLVVKPGDSLWSIAQEQFRTEDATPQQIGNEVQRIIELNRDLVRGNPDLILPGQELLLAPVAEPAAAPFEPFAEPDNVARRLIGLGSSCCPPCSRSLWCGCRPREESALLDAVDAHSCASPRRNSCGFSTRTSG